VLTHAKKSGFSKETRFLDAPSPIAWRFTAENESVGAIALEQKLCAYRTQVAGSDNAQKLADSVA
jgi:hypothetical protein